MLLDTTTVSDVKQLVADKEGFEPSRQLLRFAGRPLAPDSARLLGDLGLDQYSLAQEVRMSIRLPAAAAAGLVPAG
jgi:hypothetical protein